MCEIFKNYKELFYTFTNRHGGVSLKPYDSLNLADYVGDDIKNVIKNRLIISQKYSIDLKNLIYMNQIHSDNIEIIENSMINKIENTDAILTKERGIFLMVLVADCVPILLFDPVRKAIGAVHAGRNPTFKKISQKAVLKMKESFKSDPKDILVCMGPSIRSCCYEVSKSLADIAVKNFGKKYVLEREGRFYLDLQTLNKDELLEAGVREENIEISNRCTCCLRDYFSYRRERVTGRFAAIIGLR